MAPLAACRCSIVRVVMLAVADNRFVIVGDAGGRVYGAGCGRVEEVMMGWEMVETKLWCRDI